VSVIDRALISCWSRAERARASR